jgi:electron transport complex protein RnfD
MPDSFVVSASPHIRRPLATSAAMKLVCIALLPAALASVYLFGFNALSVMVVSVVTCVLTELACNRVFRKEITISDYSAVVTGILLALWMVVIGGFLAIFVAKQLFGGLGFNIFNPALAARAILLSSWPVAMTTWAMPVRTVASAASSQATDAVTGATQLGLLKEAGRSAYGNLDLFLGNVPGSLGETCKVALLLGAILLFVYEVIDWRIPVAFIGAVALLSMPFGRDPVGAMLSGGLILGAFFMATDLVTSPTTGRGRLIFGAGCGLLTALTRSYGGFPEGVCYSILFMNCLVPLIDKCVQPRVFGTKKAWSW